MRPTIPRGLFLILFYIHLSTEVPFGFDHLPTEYLNVSKLLEFSKKLRWPRERAPEDKTTSNDDYPFTSIQPLCIHTTNLGKVTPCDNENQSPVCFNTSSGNMTVCHNTNPVNPLCFTEHLKHRHVVSCNNSSTNICFTSYSGVNLKFCEESATAVCLGRLNEFQLCSSARFKRNDITQDPRVPELDLDGYYLSCEKCKLKVAMKVDDENDERPVIEILSEPKKDNDKDKK